VAKGQVEKKEYEYRPGQDMLASIFEQKRNISKELFVQNQKRVDLIQEKMFATGPV
jgi:hypothetical protein